MQNIAASFALVAGLSSYMAGPATARDAGTYDGVWSVELVTESGLCDARYSYSLAVQNGRIRPMARAAASGTTISGRVGSDGSVGLNVAARTASGSATGRLQAQSGAGIWNVSSLCSGRWTARRATLWTAQAN